MNLRRSTAAAAIVLALPVLASCGFNEQTDQVYNAAAGVDNRSGTVDVLDAQIVSAQNGSGTVVAGLANQDQNQADRLISVTAGDQASQGLTFSGPSSITIPAGGDVELGLKGQSVGQWTVTGPTVKAGSFVKITFNFQRAETITVDVPVTPSSNPMYSDVPLPQQSSSASPSRAPKASKSPKASRSTAPSPSPAGTASSAVAPSAPQS